MTASRLLLLSSLTFALGLGLACSGGPGEGGGRGGPGGGMMEKKDEPQTDPRTLVELAPVEIGSVSEALVSNGVVESEAMADLVPETTGTVVAIKAEEGDSVRKGQVLAIISNASLDASLARAQAEELRAQADYDKVVDLHAKGAVSDRELRDARYALDTAKTALSEARGVEGHTRLVSPIDGVVAVRDLEYGEVAGGQRAFQVVDLDRLRVVIKLPERDLRKLAVGLPAELSSVYDEEAVVLGHVERISPTVDPTSGTVRVTVALDDAQVLRPGQFVSVRVRVGEHADVLTVPRAAVLYEEGEPLVFRVRIEEEPAPEEPEEDGEEGKEEDGGFLAKLMAGEDAQAEDDELVEIPGPYRIARKVPVELGFVDEDLAEIVSGLEAGDEIVVVGQAGLRDEARVRSPEDPKLVIPDKSEEEQEEDAETPATDED